MMQQLSERVLLVTLPAEPQSGNETETMLRCAGARRDCDVIVDLSLVEIMSSATLCSLLILERLMNASDRQLVLCSVPPDIMGVFTRVGLHKLFRFANDDFAALQALDRSMCLDP